jgi:hypothetical protein
MVVVILVIVAASAALALMLVSSTRADRTANVMRHSSAARFRAEGALAAAELELVWAIANWRPAPTGGMVDIDGVRSAYEVEATGFALTDTDATGIQSTRTRYRIEGTAFVHGSQETALAMVDAVSVPIFQFAVFYTGDLEINPGPDMTLGGRVHTNGDLYLNCGGTLTLDSNYVHAVGDLLRRRKDDPTRSEGTVNVREWVANPFDPSEPSSFFALLSKSQMAAQGVASSSGYDSAFTAGFDAGGDGDYYGPNDWLPWALGALEYWNEPDAYTGGEGTTIQTSDHGLSEAVTPGIGSLAMFEPSAGGDFELDPVSGEYVPVAPGTGSFAKGFFHDQAGLSILAQEDGTWQAFDGTGNEITDTLAASAAVSIETMYDARQGGNVSVVQVDVGALDGSSAFPANGLLYAASYGIGAGTDLAGVRLVNGTELAAPLTVVSEGAVYVQGDFNTVDKKGAAVIADAVNLLSNSWDDSKGTSGLPRASDTTFNLAFISGNHDTTVGAYNGGFENLPRFHENWSGVPCRITGSFVNAWTSRYATGGWVYGGNRYTAPDRLWSYDTSFNDVANLPPFTPLVVTGEHVVSWAPAVL